MEFSKQQIIYDYACSLLLTPYRFGGANPLQGLDCSQLVIELSHAMGLPPPSDMTAQALYDFYLKNGVSVTEASFGTLSFYGKSVTAISHIGFCLSDTLMINAAGGGPTTRCLADAAAQSAFTKIRPIRYRQDMVSLIQVNWPK